MDIIHVAANLDFMIKNVTSIKNEIIKNADVSARTKK